MAKYGKELILSVTKGSEIYKIPTRSESVVDPSGRVFDFEGGIYRAIIKGYIPIAKKLIEIPELIEAGLIETEFTDLGIDSGFDAVLKHRKINFYNTYYEWAPNMFQDAARMLVNLADVLYGKGYAFKDGNILNVMFDYTTPKFIDFTSIIPVKKLSINDFDFPHEFVGAFRDQWFGFFEKITSNLNKALLSKLIEENKRDARKFFSLVLENIDKAEFKYDTTEWRGYGAKPFVIGNLNPKYQAFYDFLVEIKDNAKTVLDIGANKGVFSLAAEELGYDIISFDIDIYSIMRLYDYSKENNKRVLPLVMDFLNPTRKISGTPSAIERLKCDVTAFLAVIHHLCLRRGITFEQIIDRLDMFTNQYCIVEFIPLGDKHVGGWSKPSWYTQENFVNIMKQRGLQLIRQVPSEPLPRQMLLFERK